jgi:predicted DNA-binding protein (UPF0251 family)
MEFDGTSMMHRRRRRRGSRGRLPTPVYIGRPPVSEVFIPHPSRNESPINLEPEEIEVLRLVDLEGLSQEEAGSQMGVSRGTIWRLLHRARKKTVQALIEGRQINLSTEETRTEKSVLNDRGH